MEGPDQDTLRTRKTLLSRIKNLEDAASWMEFVQTYERLVKGIARRKGVSEVLAEDVAQEVFRGVAQKIHNFQHANHKGSFRKWLCQMVRWRADDMMRDQARHPAPPISPHTEEEATATSDKIAAEDHFADDLEAEARRQLLHLALKRLQSRVNPRQIQMFQCLVFEGWDVTKVASMFKTNPAAVYVAKHRVASKLRAEIERLQRELE